MFDVTVSTLNDRSVRLIYRKHMSTDEIVMRLTHERATSHGHPQQILHAPNMIIKGVRRRGKNPEKNKKSKKVNFKIKEIISNSVKLWGCGTAITLQ